MENKKNKVGRTQHPIPLRNIKLRAKQRDWDKFVELTSDIDTHERFKLFLDTAIAYQKMTS